MMHHILHILLFWVLPIAVGSALLGLIGWLFWRRFRPAKAKIKTDNFQTRWKALQKLLSDKKKWAEAITSADALLDEALKKKHYRGRSQGARMVNAQRVFKDNDSVWFAHKLRNKLAAAPGTKLKEKEVKQALMGIRQALKDLGALPS